MDGSRAARLEAGRRAPAHTAFDRGNACAPSGALRRQRGNRHRNRAMRAGRRRSCRPKSDEPGARPGS